MIRKLTEKEQLDVIINRKFDNTNINYDILADGIKESIDLKIQKFENFIQDNKDFLTSDKSDDEIENISKKAKELWNELAETIKFAPCKLYLNGNDISFLKNRLKYNSETVYYGLILKKNWYDSLPKIKPSDINKYECIIPLTQSVLLMRNLSTTHIEGLNSDALSLAWLSYEVGEMQVLYMHYNEISEKLSKVLINWNLGISEEDSKKLEEAVVKQQLEDSGITIKDDIVPIND